MARASGASLAMHEGRGIDGPAWPRCWRVMRAFATVVSVARRWGALSGFVYHRRVGETAPVSAKPAAGVRLSVGAVVGGGISQLALAWMTFPLVNISVAVVGSFVFPFAIVGQMQKAVEKDASHNK